MIGRTGAAANLLDEGEAVRQTPSEGHLFAQLIEAAIQEVIGRYPDYFSQFSVGVPHVACVVRDYRSIPALQQFSSSDLELALVRGAQVLEDLGASVYLTSAGTDAVSTMLLQSILDAHAAVHGAIVLRPSAVRKAAELAPQRHAIRQTGSGVMYVRSKGEGRPLLIITATGTPLRLWSTLINDVQIGRPCIVVQSAAGSLLDGGTPNRSSLLEDVAAIKEVLAAEEIHRVDVLAWCNGSRTAIALAREALDRVCALMLISPTFHGTMDPRTYPSPFEDSLLDAFEIVKSDPEAGRHLIDSFVAVGPPEVATLSAEKRVDTVLRAPPVHHLQQILLPLSTVDYFDNFMRRVLNEEAYDVTTALEEIRCPIWCVTGTHDAAINTRLSHDVLAMHGRKVTEITVFGAGHHVHLLQYGYLRYLLQHLESASLPVTTARVKVETLASRA